ncbi:hypothetical protein GGR95_003530, partial [Sulfitobacter undariae]|nr:hypothetical protein [Sulfitobacter undariae]
SAPWRNSLIIHLSGLNLRSGAHKEGGVGAPLTDEECLVADMIELTRQYGRYGIKMLFIAQVSRHLTHTVKRGF